MSFQIAVVNYDSEKFVSSLYESLRTKTKDDFVFNICDNGSSKQSQESIRELCRIKQNVRLFWRQQGNESASAIHHARAVDLMISSFDPSDYCLVIDVDCYMFKFDWLKWLIAILGDSDCISTVRQFLPKTDLRAMPYVSFFKVDAVQSRNISFMPDTEHPTKERDFGYKLNDLMKIVPFMMVSPSPTLRGLPKALVKKSMDFVYRDELIAQHMKMGGRGFKSDFYGQWLNRCKDVDRKVNPKCSSSI